MAKKLFLGFFWLIKSVIKWTVIGVLFFVFLQFMMAGIDYIQLRNQDFPVFCTSFYDSSLRLQTFQGFFYKATRTVKSSGLESLAESGKVEFEIFSWKFPIYYRFPTVDEAFQIETKETVNCKEKAHLYFANLSVKVYLYCLDDIDVKSGSNQSTLFDSLMKNISILDDIDARLDYRGLEKDGSTFEFVSKDDSFTTHGLKMYRCHKNNMNDVYIGPKDMTFQDDFCTYKDDDFSFLYELVDETPVGLVPKKNEAGETIPDVFFEDTNYRYQFSLPKSSYVFITTPEVRGKASTKTPLKEALQRNLVTIEELASKGLTYERVSK